MSRYAFVHRAVAIAVLAVVVVACSGSDVESSGSGVTPEGGSATAVSPTDVPVTNAPAGPTSGQVVETSDQEAEVDPATVTDCDELDTLINDQRLSVYRARRQYDSGAQTEVDRQQLLVAEGALVAIRQRRVSVGCVTAIDLAPMELGTSSDAALVAQVGALNNCDLIQAVIEQAAEKREEFVEQMDPEGDKSAFSEALDGFNRYSALSQKAIERDAIVGCAELLPLLSDG